MTDRYSLSDYKCLLLHLNDELVARLQQAQAASEIAVTLPFREMLASARDSFKASRMTADELDALVKEER